MNEIEQLRNVIEILKKRKAKQLEKQAELIQVNRNIISSIQKRLGWLGTTHSPRTNEWMKSFKGLDKINTDSEIPEDAISMLKRVKEFEEEIGILVDLNAYIVKTNFCALKSCVTGMEVHNISDTPFIRPSEAFLEAIASGKSTLGWSD